jgi:hypothetical protein
MLKVILIAAFVWLVVSHWDSSKYEDHRPGAQACLHDNSRPWAGMGITPQTYCNSLLSFRAMGAR